MKFIVFILYDDHNYNVVQCTDCIKLNSDQIRTLTSSFVFIYIFECAPHYNFTIIMIKKLFSFFSLESNPLNFSGQVGLVLLYHAILQFSQSSLEPLFSSRQATAQPMTDQLALMMQILTLCSLAWHSNGRLLHIMGITSVYQIGRVGRAMDVNVYDHQKEDQEDWRVCNSNKNF